MIRPEQLAQALDRIHPRDRELLSLSLRRRVPDEALGQLYECEPSEVARRRARAIERLADEMELQRGEDLGAVLKALLEPDTWGAVAATLGEEFAVGAGGRLTAVPPPAGAEITATGPAPVPVPVPAQGDTGAVEAEPAAPAERHSAAEAEPAERDPAAEAEAPAGRERADAEPKPARSQPGAAASEPAAAPPAPEPRSTASPEPRTQPPPEILPPPKEPVLEMLAAREREAPDPPQRAVPLAIFGLCIATLVGAGGVVGATQFGEADSVIRSQSGADDTTRHFIPEQGGFLEAPFPTDPNTISCYSTARVPRATTLYRTPGGRKRVRITPRTEWGSPRVLGVVKQRGAWLAVQAPELRNGELAWVRRERTRLDCVRWSLHADLSERTLSVRRDGRTVRKMTVAVGRRENPTPEGRFTVTDKLRVTDGGSAYGCCVLALSGHQTDLPEYWPGGDRLAVHATSDESSIGQPVSLGCLRTQARRARWLIETVPLGAPMFIRA